MAGEHEPTEHTRIPSLQSDDRLVHPVDFLHHMLSPVLDLRGQVEPSKLPAPPSKRPAAI